MDVRRVDRPDLIDETPVTLTQSGNIYQMHWQEHVNERMNIVRLDQDHYMLINDKSKTVYEFKHADNRSESAIALRRTFKSLRDLVNANTVHPERCRWVTLTYAECMTDDKRLRRDLRGFSRALRKVYGEYQYIAVREPQGRGAWHMHLILIFPSKAPYIESGEIRKAWKQGIIVSCKAMDNCDNIGAYLSAYMSDLPLDQAAENGDLQRDAQITVKDYKDGRGTKKVVKGGRLCLYPPGMNLYTTSRGVERPKKEKMTYEEAQKRLKASEATLTYESTLEMSQEDFTNRIHNSYYSTVRSKVE